MAEIHVLSIRGLASDQVARLKADLAGAHEAGTDLGSRVPHIHAAGAALQGLADELRCALDGLRHALGDLGLHDPALGETLGRVAAEAAELGEVACRFPVGE